jgi:hypothetical protein
LLSLLLLDVLHGRDIVGAERAHARFSVARVQFVTIGV